MFLLSFSPLSQKSFMALQAFLPKTFVVLTSTNRDVAHKSIGLTEEPFQPLQFTVQVDCPASCSILTLVLIHPQLPPPYKGQRGCLKRRGRRVGSTRNQGGAFGEHSSLSLTWKGIRQIHRKEMVN